MVAGLVACVAMPSLLTPSLLTASLLMRPALLRPALLRRSSTTMQYEQGYGYGAQQGGGADEYYR